jgi:amino acid adenylation domain-containing protein
MTTPISEFNPSQTEIPETIAMNRRHIPSAWNDTAVDYPQDQVIHQLFEAQVERTPESTAFIFENDTLTYRDLNERANRLAHYLRRAGVGPEVWVGLCLDRSPAMVVSILAVLKAGGAYVPLEPTVPRLRLWHILQDTKPPFLLLQSQLDQFDEYSGQKVYLDHIESQLAQAATTNLACLTTGDNLLNIVYTSASTGIPKGALTLISAVLNRLYWMWDEYPFRDDDVAVFHKSYALVAATWECFGGLLKGIPTLVLTRQDVLDPTILWWKLVEHRVSYLLATPGLLQSILGQTEQKPGQWTSLRLTTTSAEPMPPALARRWCKKFPSVPLLNLYGSTECSSNVTVYNAQNLPPDAKHVPIGKPFANNQIYILNDDLQPVPIGEIGEMCVAGACLARGYHNLPELTSEKFIKNPFMPTRGAEAQEGRGEISSVRLYKTGDLARYLPDGTIELVGRKDNQVKIRGFRVELEDVELTLSEQEAVKKCAVCLHHDPALGDCLAAYVVLNGETTAVALRHFLHERLPEYMIPAQITRLEAIPLTATGKIDRQKLPPPDESWSQRAADNAAPRNALENTICQVVQEVLQTERVDIEDYFLDLGLHSLLMVQVQNKLSDLLQLDISITALLQYATVSDLAQHLSQALETDNDPLRQGRDRAEKRRAMRRQRRGR